MEPVISSTADDEDPDDGAVSGSATANSIFSGFGCDGIGREGKEMTGEGDEMTDKGDEMTGEGASFSRSRTRCFSRDTSSFSS
jgi:hypothetical protein